MYLHYPNLRIWGKYLIFANRQYFILNNGDITHCKRSQGTYRYIKQIVTWTYVFTELVRPQCHVSRPMFAQGTCQSRDPSSHLPFMQVAFLGAPSVLSLISAFQQRLISHTFFLFLSWDSRIKTHVLHPPPSPSLLSISQMLCSSGYDCICQPQKPVVAISDQRWVISFWYLKTCIISISCYRVV